ncbi:hypothetical protein V8F06_004741 [Rhypophila decipiens]
MACLNGRAFFSFLDTGRCGWLNLGDSSRVGMSDFAQRGFILGRAGHCPAWGRAWLLATQLKSRVCGQRSSAANSAHLQNARAEHQEGECPANRCRQVFTGSPQSGARFAPCTCSLQFLFCLAGQVQLSQRGLSVPSSVGIPVGTVERTGRGSFLLSPIGHGRLVQGSALTRHWTFSPKREYIDPTNCEPSVSAGDNNVKLERIICSEVKGSRRL